MIWRDVQCTSLHGWVGKNQVLNLYMNTCISLRSEICRTLRIQVGCTHARTTKHHGNAFLWSLQKFPLTPQRNALLWSRLVLGWVQRNSNFGSLDRKLYPFVIQLDYFLIFRCLCKKGFFFHNGECITEAECGCIKIMNAADQSYIQYKVCTLMLYSMIKILQENPPIWQDLIFPIQLLVF